MTLLLSARGVTKSFGQKCVADHIDLFVSRGEKIALVGVNGCGKSTLLSMLAGAERPEEGEVIRRRGIRVGYLSQNPPVDPALTAREEVALGLVEINQARARLDLIEAALTRSAQGDDVNALLEEQASLQQALEEAQGWNPEHQIDTVMRALGVSYPDRPLGSLSGGERKRAALGRVVLSRPDLLLLDEPTNHLDADTVLWLEDFLAEFSGGVVFVTHDRYFLDRVATRTAELHKGALTLYEGGFEDYLQGKAERLEKEARSEEVRLNLVRTELEWLRRGPKARGTKQKARIDRAKTLIDNKPDREQKLFDLASAFTTPRLGKTILEVNGLSHHYGEKQVLDRLSFALRSGDRVGVIGPNGAGKSTLLKALVREIETPEDAIVLGKNTEISYFAQQRAALPEEQTLWEVVGNGADFVDVGGHRYHLAGYLSRFLFDAGAHRQKIKSLSGGEKARAELAILLQRPSNVLLLDEPTNDLDLQTLQALESALVEFAGSCIVVTHDRYFLDKIATAVLVLEPGEKGAKATRYEGNYETYRSLREKAEREKAAEEKAASAAKVAAKPAAPKAAPKRRSLPEEREFSELPQKIEAAEEVKGALEARLSDPELYKRPDEAKKVREGIEKATRIVEALYARWEELDAKGSES